MSNSQISLKKNTTVVELMATACPIGKDYLVILTGGDNHIGAVAAGGFQIRSFSSVLTMPNHRDDIIAKESASRVSRELKCNCAVVVGVHVENITTAEVNEIVSASFTLVDELIEELRWKSRSQ
jgi:hypothetical protein